MPQAMKYRNRRAGSLIRAALEDTRVVIINGARQTGKSTLAEEIIRQFPDSRIQYLDEQQTRAEAEADVASFVRHDGVMMIDEVQRVPDLWLEIKHSVDRDPRPGRFLLTGSARLLTLNSLADSLPGRSETIELWPLSQGEIHDAPDGFVNTAFAVGADLPVPGSQLRRKDYLERAQRGGFPDAALRDSPARRQRFFASYLGDILNRDVKQAGKIKDAKEMSRLIRLLAGQTSGLVNYSRLANVLELSAPTVERYCGILETVFLVRSIPGWRGSAGGRAVAAPKVMFTDPGMAASLTQGIQSAAKDGGLLENFVLSELGKQLSWSNDWIELYHYRDRDQYEVDAVLEHMDGRVIGVEVKAAESVRGDDFRGLRKLRQRLGEQFVAGFVMYCGERVARFGDRLSAVPMSALWTVEDRAAE